MKEPSEPENRPAQVPHESTLRLELTELDDYLQRIRRRLSTRPLGKQKIEDILPEENQETFNHLQVRFSAPPAAALRIHAGPYQGKWIMLTEDCSELLVGRSRESTVEMSRDPLLSRAHFKLRVIPPVQPGQGWHTLQVIDANSTNGTYVNGQKLAPNEPAFLQSGDTITAGSSELDVILYDIRPRFKSR